MGKVVTIAYDAVNAILHKPPVEAKLEVQSALSYLVDGAEETLAFRQHRWDGRSSFFDFAKCSFPAGFVVHVTDRLKKAGFEVKLARKPLPAPLGPARPVVDSYGYDPRYDYQPEVMDRLVRHGQIIAQVATGGGKSRIAMLCQARINRPTLFLTTRSILMYQMKDAFEANGVACSVIGDGSFGQVNEKGQLSIKKMTVGMVQTLAAKLEETTLEKEFQILYDNVVKKHEKEISDTKKQLIKVGKVESEIKKLLHNLALQHEKELQDKAPAMQAKAEAKFKEKSLVRQQTIKLLELFEFVILEEAHEAGGNSYYEIMRHCKNAYYRLALTGTPFMRESQESNMRLMACSGPIAIKVTEKMLIDRGILAKPYFKIVELKKKPAKLHSITPWQAAYRLGIVQNEERNNAICMEILKAREYGMTAMVLVQHTSHGDTLLKLFDDIGIRARYIRGEDDQGERKSALTELANKDIDVLIGTTILDVGVDVPAVGLIILAGGGKAEVALRQRIGRGLRAKKFGPNVAFIVDFTDQHNSTLKSHARQRLQIIRETPGFGENIVANFEFEKLGFKKAA
ncbi:DEAD/DEAH box helicase [Acinetobacter baumannii]|uniref:DEAD/DEAH box helicase family protein n=1 Tax=Acinetobacter baumannii 21072 TaxID=1310697 RepID=A0A062IV62_ACIBA|nr:DEAD/DEAH box helicase [Acinetobacter baumannii]EKX0188529.1 DEAD/DEAH box helicase [Acinetobacter baumannii]KCY22377.1 DEAD/DEAH box helicase family protein [Acinetobacter baumannii 21072]MBJ9707350.1 DEAD/DEAH box helicase [Acinetobacter baumannii]MBW3009023.1 DEAD/DEAH box helicase [Acinetobacter baumannii]MCD0196857.1 DEAD/DEAH box helicase [Acinetobacter baumannii]